MSDVKRLLAEATPLPWGVGAGEDEPYPHITTPDGHGFVAEAGGGQDAEHGHADAALIVYAVNRLPDYEAAVEALEQTVHWIEAECQPEAEWVAKGHNWSMSEDDRNRAIAILAVARAALARLREAVPA